MIRVRYIFVSHPPHAQGKVMIYLSLHSAKKRKKAAKGVRFELELEMYQSLWAPFEQIAVNN